MGSFQIHTVIAGQPVPIGVMVPLLMPVPVNDKVGNVRTAGAVIVRLSPAVENEGEIVVGGAVGLNGAVPDEKKVEKGLKEELEKGAAPVDSENVPLAEVPVDKNPMLARLVGGAVPEDAAGSDNALGKEPVEFVNGAVPEDEIGRPLEGPVVNGAVPELIAVEFAKGRVLERGEIAVPLDAPVEIATVDEIAVPRMEEVVLTNGAELVEIDEGVPTDIPVLKGAVPDRDDVVILPKGALLDEMGRLEPPVPPVDKGAVPERV